MPGILDFFIARAAFLHVRGLYARFLAALSRPDAAQEHVLAELLRARADTDFARHFGLRGVKSVRDFRRAMPILTYEEHRPFISRVMDGDVRALFPPRTRIHMFATTSGTTSRPKFVPVTQRFVREYRRGWNTFGAKLMLDHPDAMLRPILQISGRVDESRTPTGLPCGAITGLLARTQKRIVRRHYVGSPLIAELDDTRARHYALMRFGVSRDVAFAVTASPATLIQLARVADESSETLLRDIRDGTLSPAMIPDASIRAALAQSLRPDPRRAAELDALRRAHGRLRPRDYWRLSFLGCWTGGTMGMYLDTLHDWYGDTPVRDIGLLASEGRVTIPLETGSASGALDVLGGYFEFIPVQSEADDNPPILTARELAPGAEYIVVLTNFSGLTRYRLNDVVRVEGRVGATPQLRFLRRAGRVVSLSGEKLTENQVVTAVENVCMRRAVPAFPFVVAPRWDDPPFYELLAEAAVPAGGADELDRELGTLNCEYASKRKSARIGMLRVTRIAPGALAAMDRLLLSQRQSRSEQYKRPCLIVLPEELDALRSATNR